MTKTKRKKWQPFILGLLIVTCMFGIYITYESLAHKKIAENAQQGKASAADIAGVEDNHSDSEKVAVDLEEEISNENIISKLVSDEITTRKKALASLEVPARSKPVTNPVDKDAPAVQEAKPVEKDKPVEAEKPLEIEKPVESEKQVEPEKPIEAEKPAVNLNSTYNTSLNSYVLDVIKTYSGGRYPYLLNNDYANYNGVTTNLYFQDKLLLKAHPSGNKYSHCSGITYEVFFKAIQNRNKKLGLSPNDINGMTYDEMYDFILSWYVASGNKKANNVSSAVQKYGIGKRITNFEEAKSGDFMDISRENNTGHTVVFLNWLRDNNSKIIGFKYWSSQESTAGISYKEEYFNLTNSEGTKYGNVMIDMVYIARVNAVKDYKKLR